MPDIVKLKSNYTLAILHQMPTDYYDYLDFIQNHYPQGIMRKTNKMDENNQNKLNRIRYKALYPPSTYQTTSDFSHNNNNYKSL